MKRAMLKNVSILISLRKNIIHTNRTANFWCCRNHNGFCVHSCATVCVVCYFEYHLKQEKLNKVSRIGDSEQNLFFLEITYYLSTGSVHIKSLLMTGIQTIFHTKVASKNFPECIYYTEITATKSMELSTTQEATTCAATREPSSNLRNPNLYYPIQTALHLPLSGTRTI
jgi:hypothetical protein